MSNGTVQVHARLEPELVQRLQEESERRGLSVNRFLAFLLKQCLPALSRNELSSVGPEKLQ